MTIVVDVGCADHHGKSMQYLLDRFDPDEFWGFDPYPSMDEYVLEYGETCIRIAQQAAWTYDGEIAFRENGDCSRVGEGDLTVPCFDLAAWLAQRDEGAILKMDAEGAEYELLPHLIATDQDKRLSLLLIEWHPDDHGLTDQLRCPVEIWPF